MLSSSNIVVHGASYAAFGALFSALVGSDPVQGACYLGTFAVTERVFSVASRRFCPGSEAWLGPIPVGLKNIVSFGLAIYTTFKIMQVAGFIFSVPVSIQILGISCGFVLAGGFLFTLIRAGLKTSEGLSE